MGTLNVIETTCSLTGIPVNANSKNLLDNKIALSSLGFELVRECTARPRTEGGPPAKGCENCVMIKKRNQV